MVEVNGAYKHVRFEIDLKKSLLVMYHAKTDRRCTGLITYISIKNNIDTHMDQKLNMIFHNRQPSVNRAVLQAQNSKNSLKS